MLQLCSISSDTRTVTYYMDIAMYMYVHYFLLKCNVVKESTSLHINYNVQLIAIHMHVAITNVNGYYIEA